MATGGGGAICTSIFTACGSEDRRMNSSDLSSLADDSASCSRWLSSMLMVSENRRPILGKSVSTGCSWTAPAVSPDNNKQTVGDVA